MNEPVTSEANKTVQLSMKELLDAGMHYGHQCKRWNPKMKRYIFGERNGVHIIDLQKTVRCLKSALSFVEDIASKRGKILFVGTKRQAQELTATHAKRCGMFFINSRWLGGTLTNYNTIRKSINRLRKLEKLAADGTHEKLTKKEVIRLERKREKLERELGGIKDMSNLPKALFITDSHKEHIATKEAKKLGIPIIAITDTNADPDPIDFPIPGNDDSHRPIEFILSAVANSIIKGKSNIGKNDNSEIAGQDELTEGTFFDQEGHSVKVVKKSSTETTPSKS